jgi:hypothetical protein
MTPLDELERLYRKWDEDPTAGNTVLLDRALRNHAEALIEAARVLEAMPDPSSFEFVRWMMYREDALSRLKGDDRG